MDNMEKPEEKLGEHAEEGNAKKERAEKPQKESKSDKKAVAELKKSLEEANRAKADAENKAKEASDSMLRIAAEYDNFRRRAVKEKEDAYTDSYADAVKEFLPVLDNLERAKSFDNCDEGMLLILKQIENVFTKLGVEEIKAKGEPFDPNFHNAVMIEENSDAEENTVTEVLQKGYMLKGKVIRFAMVKVAK